MSIEKLSMLTPKSCDLTSIGHSATIGLTPADVSAALMDCTPLQQTILLTKSDSLTQARKTLNRFIFAYVE